MEKTKEQEYLRVAPETHGMTIRKGEKAKRLPRELLPERCRCVVAGLVDTGKAETFVGPSPVEKLLMGKQLKKLPKSKKTLVTTGFSRLQRELQVHPGLPGVKSQKDAKHQTSSLVSLSGSRGKALWSAEQSCCYHLPQVPLKFPFLQYFH